MYTNRRRKELDATAQGAIARASRGPWGWGGDSVSGESSQLGVTGVELAELANLAQLWWVGRLASEPTSGVIIELPYLV